MCDVPMQPGNIFVKNGQYKLGDFGLVTPVHVRSGTDVVEGDSRYMSKELLNDDHSNLTKVPTRLGFSINLGFLLLHRLLTRCRSHHWADFFPFCLKVNCT